MPKSSATLAHFPSDCKIICLDIGCFVVSGRFHAKKLTLLWSASSVNPIIDLVTLVDDYGYK